MTTKENPMDQNPNLTCPECMGAFAVETQAPNGVWYRRPCECVAPDAAIDPVPEPDPVKLDDWSWLGDATRTGKLHIGSVVFDVERKDGGPHGVWFLATGPRGAVTGLLPYVEQPKPGIVLLFAMGPSTRQPSWATGRTFVWLPASGKLGWFAR